MNAVALFFVTHGSSDRRSWSALQALVNVARTQSPNTGDNRLISGGCLEGLELTLAQQLEQFAIEVFNKGGKEIVILPLFLLEGVHVSEDIPHEVAIAQSKLQHTLLQDSNKATDEAPAQITFRITPHLGTHSQIPSLLKQHFTKYSIEPSSEPQGQILMAHGSRRTGANQVVEDLAKQSQAIAAYWGVEPKIETQIENLIAQNISKINVLPYFLTSGGITEAIANKLSIYGDRAKIQLLPVPLSNEQIINLSLTFI